MLEVIFQKQTFEISAAEVNMKLENTRKQKSVTKYELFSVPRCFLYGVKYASRSNKKANIRWLDSAPPISGYWPTSEPNAG